MIIELNKEEATVLINLIDVAVKTVGLQAAESGVHFARKIQAAGEESGEFTPQDEHNKEE